MPHLYNDCKVVESEIVGNSFTEELGDFVRRQAEDMNDEDIGEEGSVTRIRLMHKLILEYENHYNKPALKDGTFYRDLETGKILNWKTPSESDLEDIINDSED